MASTTDLVVKVKADTSEFDKAMDHMQFRLWWYSHSTAVLLTLCAALVFLGGTIGILIGLQF